MSKANSVKIELFIKPSELNFILQILNAFKQKKVLEFKLPESESNTDFDYEKYVTEGAPLSEAELLQLVDEAEKSEKLTPEEFRQALGL